jgi:predicted membrane-bound spermidine synthase
MKALLLGVVFFAAAVFTGWVWWKDVLTFLRGAVPVIAALIALIALFVGVADLKDRAEQKTTDLS